MRPLWYTRVVSRVMLCNWTILSTKRYKLNEFVKLTEVSFSLSPTRTKTLSPAINWLLFFIL